MTTADPTADFHVASTVEGTTATVSVRGEVDLHTAPQLREELYRVISDGATVIVLDVSSMTFIDSTGLGVIVGGLKRVREAGGDLRLRGPSRATRKALDITGLIRIIEIED